MDADGLLKLASMKYRPNQLSDNKRWIGFSCFLSLMLLAIFLANRRAAAFDLPTGFENVEIFSGLAEPDGMAFSPDGRLFIAERIQGRLLVATQSGDQWTLNAEPFYTFDIPKNGL